MYYNCLEEQQYHYFCEEHASRLHCPVDNNGRRWCEVKSCNRLARKYTIIMYNCLTESDYHFSVISIPRVSIANCILLDIQNYSDKL